MHNNARTHTGADSAAQRRANKPSRSSTKKELKAAAPASAASTALPAARDGSGVRCLRRGTSTLPTTCVLSWGGKKMLVCKLLSNAFCLVLRTSNKLIKDHKIYIPKLIANCLF